MISKTWSRKPIAAVLSVAVLSVYSMIALASPEAKVPSGELSVSGQVTVNGQKVISGGTLFSDSVIVTSENSSATVNISRLGRIQLAPNSALNLSFTDKAITGQLDGGIASVSTLAGISVNLTTKDGSVLVDGSQATSFTVNAKRGNTVVSTQAGLVELRAGGAVKQIAAGESGTAGTPNPPADEDDHSISGGALAVLLIAAGGAIVAAILATREDEINFGGSVIVISPAR
ncbi:MAG: FecR domain-containing protein [Pyrinomonadaceae bacterium]|nr:FecR domain-containing protein [Pyrinomonadaceae bacterium]